MKSIQRVSASIAIGFCCVAAAVLPYAAVAASDTERNLGQALFERNCVVCHGIHGTGGRGPALNRPRLELAPDEAALRALIRSGYPPEMPGNEFLSDADIGMVAVYVRSLGSIEAQVVAGNALHGAAVFAGNGCPACHIIAGKGNAYGPALDAIGERRGAQYIRQTILDPVADLPSDFLLVRLVTGSGEVIQGIRVNEDSFSIQLKDANGLFYSYRKAGLKELQKLRGSTPMPAFKAVLRDSDLTDVVAYLSSLKGSP